MLLRCLDDSEKQAIIEQAHNGVCGGHVNALMLVKKMNHISLPITSLQWSWIVYNSSRSVFLPNSMETRFMHHHLHSIALFHVCF